MAFFGGKEGGQSRALALSAQCSSFSSSRSQAPASFSTLQGLTQAQQKKWPREFQGLSLRNVQRHLEKSVIYLIATFSVIDMLRISERKLKGITYVSETCKQPAPPPHPNPGPPSADHSSCPEIGNKKGLQQPP